MTRQRFMEQGENSRYGRFVYDRLLPRDHFLRVLLETIPWERFTHKLVKWYKGNSKEGRPPYDPSVILRVLLLSCLYKLSERQTEAAVNDMIPMKFFIIKIAKEKGIQLGTIQVMDSVDTVADANTGKDQKRQKEGEAPRDPDAWWGVKGTRQA